MIAAFLVARKPRGAKVPLILRQTLTDEDAVALGPQDTELQGFQVSFVVSL